MSRATGMYRIFGSRIIGLRVFSLHHVAVCHGADSNLVKGHRREFFSIFFLFLYASSSGVTIGGTAV